MDERQPSRTALDVAVLRAAHQLIDDPPRILDDPVILRLIGPALLARITTDPARYAAEATRRLRAHVLVRSRYAEDRLAEAAKRGVRQMISLGAGFDTFAYRQPEWARGMRLFEVDQPASQAWKRETLRQAGIETPENVTFIAVDFERETLADGLARGGVEPGEAAFFSWLGVMVYLSEEASDAVFRTVAAFPAGSEIAFTFSQPPTPEMAARREAAGLPARLAEMGEPWINFISAEALVGRLKGFGFSTVTVVTPDQIDAWYLGGRTDGLSGRDRAGIASAVV